MSVAETVLPSVRGRQRAAVAAILIGAGTASGALVGLLTALVAAVATSPFDLDLNGLALVTVVAGAALDASRLVLGRPRPPTHGRQVPREWAWIFPPAITAGLFGARLGVGPLTILSTWTWWSFTVAAALLGPATAVMAGATFGFVRLVVTAWISVSVHPAGHPAVFGRLRARQRRGWATITVLTVLLAIAAAGCGTADPGGEPARASGAIDRPAEAAEPIDNAPLVEADHGIEGAAAVAPSDLIQPAELEDVVRTSIPDLPADAAALDEGSADPATGTDPTGGERTTGPADLAATLTSAIAGYQSIDAPDADRALDLRAAAGLQPDPTEEIALLETRGFRGGWTRAFRNATNDVAVASVYEFRDPTEAEFYLEDGLITIGGYGGTFFDIPDLPGVRGFAQQIADSDGETTEDLVSIGASFHAGDRWYLLYFLGSPETVTPEVLVPAIAAQHRLAVG